MKFKLLTLILLSLTPLTSTASGNYLLEEIKLEGLQRAPENVILSISLLREGQTYSEQEIRDAVSRITRHRFILRADFRLEKKGQGQAYTLIVEVKEKFPLDLIHETQSFKEADQDTDYIYTLEGGGYWFLGSTMLEARGRARDNIDDIFGYEDPNSATLSATQFNLFGKGIEARLSAIWLEDTSRFYFERQGESTKREFDIIPSLSIYVPIKGQMAIEANFSHSREKQTTRNFISDEIQDDRLNQETKSTNMDIAWTYNTLNDELLTTSGIKAQAGLRYWNTQTKSFYYFLADPEDVYLTIERDSIEAFGSWEQYLPITERQSVWYGASVGYSSGEYVVDYVDFDLDGSPIEGNERETQSFDLISGEGKVGWSIDLWGAEQTKRLGDLRFEIEGRVKWSDLQFEGDEDNDSDFTTYEIEARLTWRTSWGRLSLAGRYWDYND